MSLSVNRVSGYQQNRDNTSFGLKVRKARPKDVMDALRDKPVYVKFQRALANYDHDPTIENGQTLKAAIEAYKNSLEYVY